jgi:tripartite-type tricarboxylate transporter receptor subunit TctC
MRRRTLVALALLSVALSAHATESLHYPVKPVRLIVPTVPGSPPDVVARIVSERLAAALGQAVVTENRPGAAGTIGLGAVAKAAPDGHTLGVMGLAYIGAPSPAGGMPYDIERDLLAVVPMNWHYTLFAVPASSAAGSVAEFVALAKARPGLLKFSSGGNGTPPHLAGELFKRQAGVDLLHIPYKGAPPSVAALIAGEVDMTISSTGALAPHLRSGRLRALATAAPQRIGAFPELPTLAELGYPDVVMADWQGIVAPAGTPQAVVRRLHAEVSRIMASENVRQRLASIGMEPASASPEEFGAHIRSELRKWATLVREAGIKSD